MQKNRIVIGKGKDNEENSEKAKNKLPQESGTASPSPHSIEIEELRYRDSLNDVLWGSDSRLHKMLDKEVLSEKRRYVRVRYFQNVLCKMIADNPQAEPLSLSKPLPLSVVDLSMGGIGVLCSQEVTEGSILHIGLVLDQSSYDIVCEVVYCVKMDNVHRIGLRMFKKDKTFTRHLKIVVARISLNAEYAKNDGSPASDS